MKKKRGFFSFFVNDLSKLSLSLQKPVLFKMILSEFVNKIDDKMVLRCFLLRFKLFHKFEGKKNIIHKDLF